MMELSRRAKRMQRHHQRRNMPTLNMISLMDIFTILVFFLLVNSTEVEELPTANQVNLPTSIAEARTRTTPLLVVSPKDITSEDKRIMSVAAALNSEQKLLTPLLPVLKRQLEQLKLDAPDQALELTVMGDQTLPYKLIKRIMATGAEAGFERVALAVVQKSNLDVSSVSNSSAEPN